MKQRRTVLAGLVVLSLALTACGGGDDTASGGGSGGGGDDAKQIAIVSPYLSQQPATKEVVDDFTAAAEAKGWEVKTVDVNNDFARMNTEISGAAGRGVDAIVLGMGDPQQMGPGLKAAKAADIPVIGLDAGAADGITANVTSDNTFLGETAAQAMIDAVEAKKVLMFTFDDFEPGTGARPGRQVLLRGQRRRGPRLRPHRRPQRPGRRQDQGQGRARQVPGR
jgi:ABC-type sugar transport system substrate-binding protein